MKTFAIFLLFFNSSVFAQDIPCYKTFFEDRLISFVPEMEEQPLPVFLLKENNFIATQNFEIDLSFVKKIEHVGEVFDHKKYVSEYGGLCVPSTSAGQMQQIFKNYLINDVILNSVFGKKNVRFTSMNNW